MISEITRKNINYSALSLVLIVLLSMFISFFQAANMSTIVNLMVKVLIPLLIIWLSYSLYTFAKEENNKEMNVVSILIFVGAIFHLIYNIISLLFGFKVLTLVRYLELIVYSSNLIGAVFFIIGFFKLKKIQDDFVLKQRSIFKGQITLVLAYIFLAVETIMLMIIPANVLLTATGEVNPDYKTYYFVLYFVDIFYDVSFVLGYWNIRKNFVVLDKIPKEYFEKKQAQEAYRDIYQPRYLIADQKPIDENLGTGETKDDSIIDTTSEKVDVKKKKKFCTKCGLELEDDAVFCPNCGERNYYD